MKNIILITLLTACIPISIFASSDINTLLKTLDKIIGERSVYTGKKESQIKELKETKAKLTDLEELYEINKKIMNLYETFICDSAERYIHENIQIAQQLDNDLYLSESRLQLAFIYSLSGLFIQANEILTTFNSEELSPFLTLLYGWTYIRYYENLIKYTDDEKLSKEYLLEKESHRKKVMSFLGENSDMYLKEKAFLLQEKGEFEETIEILSNIYEKQEPDTHGYAMAAMSLARVYNLTGNKEPEEIYLALAAITDTKLAVKENEALLTLAINLYEKGDINRSYNYIKVALDDAIFYNSRFRNTIIARVQPIIENTYLYKIEQQQNNLRWYSTLMSIFVIALALALYFNYRQIKIVTRARRNLREMNNQLVGLNKKLDEANLIKEQYIGYFMNQCAVYINKLDEYRKNVNRKIKTGQIDELYKSSSRALEKEVEELYTNFDKAFLKLYPNFIEEFNSLLKPEEQYNSGKEQLNTELRIFALIRLGITDVSQIAIFLRYSLQTIYNYKSKVKGKSLMEGDLFEEQVKKLGSIS